MATPSRESVLDSAHWTMAVGVVLDFFVSMAEAMVRVPRYMGTRKKLAMGRNFFTTASLCGYDFDQQIITDLMAFKCRNICIQEQIFNWKRDVIYMYVLVFLGGGAESERERQFLVTKKDNNYFNVNAT